VFPARSVARTENVRSPGFRLGYVCGLEHGCHRAHPSSLHSNEESDSEAVNAKVRDPSGTDPEGPDMTSVSGGRSSVESRLSALPPPSTPESHGGKGPAGRSWRGRKRLADDGTDTAIAAMRPRNMTLTMMERLEGERIGEATAGGGGRLNSRWRAILTDHWEQQTKP
jgi:hypothetical protein